MNPSTNYVLAEPWWLLLLLALPFLIALAARQGSRTWLIYPSLRVLGTLGFKPKNKPRRWGPILIPLVLIPAIIALARPQETKTRTSRTASGIDILIALDVSYSMSARDYYESGSLNYRPETRISAAKKIITEFIKRRPDDRIGIVSFAARPYTVAPITLDHQVLAFTLRDVALVNDNDEGGTAIGSAIAAAGHRLEKIDQSRDPDSSDSPPSKSKVIILVTDGANNSGQLAPLEAARLVAELGIKVYPVAIGSPQGRVPGISGAASQQFDPQTLQEIASLTQGDFYHATDYDTLRSAFKSIDELEKTEVKRNTWIIRKELYPWFLGASVVLLLGLLTVRTLNPPPMP